MIDWPRRLALTISLVGHPFLLGPAVILIVGWRIVGAAQALYGVLTIVAACLLPAAVYINRRVQRHEWSDLDVSARKDRPHLFALGLGLLAVTTTILCVTRQPPLFTRACLGAMALLTLGCIANRWLKVSMHTGFTMLVGGAFWRHDPPVAMALAALAAAVGWSRVELKRHTGAEVVTGWLMAAAVALAVYP